MDDITSKYLEDVLKAITEIEMATNRFGKFYEVFVNDIVYRRFVERNIEIIGEAINRALKINPYLPITSARKIVDTRNFVIHAYDSLKPDLLWTIVINHIPRLKNEITAILND